MPTFELKKLVRRGLPERYEKAGQDAEIRLLEGDELRMALLDKFQEEINELPDPSGDSAAIASELADVRQVVMDLLELGADISEQWNVIRATYPNITDAEIEKQRVEKNAKKGNFSAGIFVVRLTLQLGDPWIEYYRNEPHKYPEVEAS